MRIECTVGLRVAQLWPWLDSRLHRAIRDSDTAAGFRAVALMNRLLALEANNDHAWGEKEWARLDRRARALHSN
jgi:hypothetical protein